MGATAISPFQRALDVVERLPQDQQEHLIDVIRRRRIEARRAEIAASIRETTADLKAGRAKRGAVRDLMRDLRSCAG